MGRGAYGVAWISIHRNQKTLVYRYCTSSYPWRRKRDQPGGGREAIVESPDHSFEPFIVHYAETFIIPAAVGAYTIRPYGESAGKKCGTLKAFVRTDENGYH